MLAHSLFIHARVNLLHIHTLAYSFVEVVHHLKEIISLKVLHYHVR